MASELQDIPEGGLPPAAKSASEKAVKAALSESVKDGDGEAADDAPSNGLVTVLHNPSEFNVVHPLHSTWTLWFDNASKQDKAKDWNEQLQQVMEIDSVEEFWGLYNNIVPPSHIAVNSNYYLFKKGIKPAWEDPANAQGGKWAIQCPRDKSREKIDEWWLYTMLAAIGETLETPYVGADAPPAASADFPDQVTGVIVSSRKMFYRLNVWTRTSEDRAKLEMIGRQFKYNCIGAPDGKKLGNESARGISSDVEFTSHNATQSRGSKSKGWTV